MKHGSRLDPPNRFESTTSVPDFEQFDEWDETASLEPSRPIEYLPDDSQSIVVENNSPDVFFRYSVNPYRGCVHGCSYCYARNSHEYLGMNAGLDFETKILVKHAAPKLLREFLARQAWQPEPLMFSGITDCYQPAERKYRLTRACLEVTSECSQPVNIITKNALVVRDLHLLASLAERKLIHVGISITTLRGELARSLEPRTSIPSARLRAVETLAKNGIPVRVMVAPIIPGLNDHEVPAILKAAREAGATDARYVLLRLPLTVEPVFREWLAREQPLAADKVEHQVRETRGGKMNDSEWGRRLRGVGQLAEQISSLFNVFRAKLGFQDLPPLDCTSFHPPRLPNQQLRLF